MSNTLEERLKQHSNAFDGLLSLIPAKYYYDEDTSNQWQQKRKTKEEHQTNKRHKLDPEANQNKTAKDVLKENEANAKPVVLPGEKFKQQMALRRSNAQNDTSENEEATNHNDSELSEDDNGDVDDNDDDDEKNPETTELIQDNVTIIFDDNGEEIAREEEYKKANVVTVKKSGKKELTPEELEARERKHKELKAKLQAKIQSMREKRKAPGTKIPGAATSRQQILEERRRKAELKKEQRSNQILNSVDDDVESSSDDEIETEDGNPAANVMFGNIEFLDGERASSDLKSTRKVGKKKGPANNDIKGHLKVLEREKARIEALDNETKSKLQDKHKWQKALASVQGVKVKDDEKLLKKALRRKESKKRKSEREWKDRIQAVHDEKKMKTDRREENLRIRKENKGKSRKDQIKQLPSYKRSRGSRKLVGSKISGSEKGGKKNDDGRAGRGGKGKRAGFEGGIKSHKKK
ncbi:hypothetical protein CANINC_003356 [Pichia inconspicua]|uniref:Ribosomal RNA-processing protein 14/surfeit locus protein 6 C-terminal domain-containing protein n=1 Tax=Pichia inconspicua TaxID=52247 RepID=A0A4T0WZG8_9ASCO|nr:hypothetical protein CANINC_003356 [[Candida] inconspicua]